MKSLALVVLAAIVAPIAAQAQAQQDGAGFSAPEQGLRGRGEGRFGQGDRGGRRGRMFADLGLSEKQRTQISAIMKESREHNRPLFEKMQALRAAKVGGSSLDDKAIADMRSLRQEIRKQRQATNEKIQALLTPEQKAKFAERQRGFAGGAGSQ